MDVSIVIVAGNERGYLGECLAATQRACDGVASELILVDNASSDGAATWVPTKFKDVRILRQERPLHLGAARNLGLAAASAELLLFVDADAQLSSDAVRAMVGFMSDRGDVGIVGPKLTYPDGRLQESCRAFQTWLSFIKRGLGFSPGSRDRAFVELARTSEQPFEVDWVLGACQMVRRSAIDRIGTMDEGYVLYYVDVEWCWRMKRAGWAVFYLPMAGCVHHYQRRSAGFPPNRWTLTHVRDFLRFRAEVRRSRSPRKTRL
jgi:GT2 family glycosyltransferase